MAAVIAALGTAIVNIISALRYQKSEEFDRRLHACEERAAADWGLSGERDARLKKQGEIERWNEQVDSRLRELESARKR